MEKSNKEKLALRMDDVGASSKQFEVYSKKWKGLGNFTFLKYLPYFAAWGPYREMTADEFEELFNLISKYNAKLTMAITACWVEKDGTLIPYPEKFPAQAKVIKNALNSGILEIANHGLSHCVLKDRAFLPKLFRSNRVYHREFWDWPGNSVHKEHIEKSQEILNSYFNQKITTLVPPGNVFCNSTIDAAKANGIKRINCYIRNQTSDQVDIISNENIIPFHDRELVLYGVNWLENILKENRDAKWCFVKELTC